MNQCEEKDCYTLFYSQLEKEHKYMIDLNMEILQTTLLVLTRITDTNRIQNGDHVCILKNDKLQHCIVINDHGKRLLSIKESCIIWNYDEGWRVSYPSRKKTDKIMEVAQETYRCWTKAYGSWAIFCVTKKYVGPSRLWKFNKYLKTKQDSFSFYL